MITKQRIDELFTYRDGMFFHKAIRRGVPVAGVEAGTWSNTDGYKYINIDNKRYPTHRIVFFYHNEYFPQEVDHIDGNRTNNIPSNLRAANHTENMYNCTKHSSNTTGIKGVYWNDNSNSYHARIRIGNGKRISIGYFKDIKDAEIAINNARKQFHGEFARAA